jgi:ABC-type nitrate/sulfonate/bicarbonate transport system substrate-binding protein
MKLSRWGRWSSMVAGLAIASALPLAACGGGDEELQPATLMLDWTPNTNHAGIYVALEQGWYEEAGIDLQIVEPAAAGVEAILAEGQAQFGISYAEYLIPARLAGVEITSIAAMLPHNESSLMLLAAEGVTRPADLAGLTYGGFGGALERQLISTLVECDGGDPSLVNFVEVGNIDYVPGMEQDRFDFVWVFEGWDVLRARALDGVEVTTLRFIDYTDCIPDWYTPVIATSDALIESDPDLVSAFLEATARGYEYAMERPEESAAALLAAAPELDQGLVERSAAYLGPRYADEGQAWGVQEAAIWERFEAFLREAGLTDAELDVRDAFTNEFLP